ncbi:MAG: S-layer homology domain-containing protein [Bacillota bacterium]|nr:S-layer homology domain-containing protein [Bacillota bacterium]
MKKATAFVLVLTLVLGSLGFAFGAGALSDVAGTKYEEAVTALAEAGVVEGYPDGSFLPGNSITRAEACKIVVLAAAEGNRVPAAALEAAAGAAAESFSDVSADFWAAPYIGYAVEQGVVNGYPDGSFRAGQNVTYYELVKMMAAAMGVEEDSLTGQWPDNYESAAETLGLLENVSYTDGNAAASRGDVAIVAYNGSGLAPAEEEDPAETPDEDGGDAFDLSKFRGALIGVIQGTESILNAEEESVSAVDFLLGSKYAGTVPAKKNSAADTAIAALDQADYLDGALYALRIVKGEITEISAVTSSAITWADDCKELTPASALTGGAVFAAVDSIHQDAAVLFSDLTAPGTVEAIGIGETLVVYLLKENSAGLFYELGDIGDVKRNALVRLYDASDDDGEAANIIIVDQR